MNQPMTELQRSMAAIRAHAASPTPKPQIEKTPADEKSAGAEDTMPETVETLDLSIDATQLQSLNATELQIAPPANDPTTTANDQSTGTVGAPTVQDALAVVPLSGTAVTPAPLALIRQWSEAYRRAGLHPLELVGPCVSRSEKVKSPGKQPGHKGWQTEPHPLHLDTYRDGCNLGLRMGRQTNGQTLVCVDVDAEDPAVLQEIFPTWPETLIQQTGKGRWHFLYTWPSSVPLPGNRVRLHNREGSPIPVDIRADGGQIVAAPSIHPETGRPYQWMNAGTSPVEIPEENARAILALAATETKHVAASSLALATSLALLAEPIELQPVSDAAFRDACKGLAKRNLYGAAFEALLRGVSLAEPGQRDQVITGMCWALAKALPNATPESIARWFETSLSNMHALSPFNSPCDVAAKVRSAQAKHRARQGQPVASPEGLPEVVIADPGQYFWRLGPENDYSERCSERLLESTVAFLFGDTRFRTDTGKFNRSEVQKLSKPAKKILVSYGQAITTYDPESREVTTGLRLDEKIEPVWDADVEAWLVALFGDRLDSVKNWIAGCHPRYLNSPAAALCLVGPKSVGKSLFGEALAGLWGSPAIEGNNMTARFNGQLAKCPIVSFDEEIDEKLGPDAFKRCVAKTSHEIELKGQDKTTLRGCLRAILSVNGFEKLRLVGAKAFTDLDAIAERMFVVTIPDARIEPCLAALAALPMPGGAGNRDLDRIARHFRWILENVDVLPTSRFIGSDATSITRDLLLGLEASEGTCPEVWALVSDYLENRASWEAAYRDTRSLTSLGPNDGVIARTLWPLLVSCGALYVRPNVLGVLAGQKPLEARRALLHAVQDRRASLKIRGQVVAFWQLRTAALPEEVQAALKTAENTDRRNGDGS